MTIGKPQTFEPDARAIPYAIEGDGPVVVLLPTRGLTIVSLRALASVLAEEGFRVVRIGYRAPAPGHESLTLHDLAQDVVDVLDHLELRGVWVAGHGFGGIVARTVALDHAGRVDGIALFGVEAPEQLPDDVAWAMRLAFSDLTGEEERAAVAKLAGVSVDPGFAWDVFSHTRDVAIEPLQAAALAATPAAEWAPLAPRIPVLIVQGTDDVVAPVAHGEELRASAPERASIASIPGGGYLFPLTHPGEIGAEIEDYLGWD